MKIKIVLLIIIKLNLLLFGYGPDSHGTDNITLNNYNIFISYELENLQLE